MRPVRVWSHFSMEDAFQYLKLNLLQLVFVLLTQFAAILRFPKDRLPVLLQQNVINSLACTCGCRYVGRTVRHLEAHISEHFVVCFNSGVAFKLSDKWGP